MIVFVVSLQQLSDLAHLTIQNVNYDGNTCHQVAKTIARQYGVHYTDEVAALSFDVKSKWLPCYCSKDLCV